MFSVLWILYSRFLDSSLQMPTDVPEDRLNNEEKETKVGNSSGADSSNIPCLISQSGVEKSDGMMFDTLFF